MQLPVHCHQTGTDDNTAPIPELLPSVSRIKGSPALPILVMMSNSSLNARKLVHIRERNFSSVMLLGSGFCNIISVTGVEPLCVPC